VVALAEVREHVGEVGAVIGMALTALPVEHRGAHGEFVSAYSDGQRWLLKGNELIDGGDELEVRVIDATSDEGFRQRVLVVPPETVAAINFALARRSKGRRIAAAVDVLRRSRPMHGRRRRRGIRVRSTRTGTRGSPAGDARPRRLADDARAA
jgi:hypothetical protein